MHLETHLRAKVNRFHPHAPCRLTTGPWAWIGLTDIKLQYFFDEDESIFRWLNNAPLHYEAWNEATNEPNGRLNENCVRIRRPSLKWVDISCGGTGSVLCSTTGENFRSFCQSLVDLCFNLHTTLIICN